MSIDLSTATLVTVVYRIVDHKEWDKRNPLHYEHDGLKAVGVAIGDLMQHVDMLEALCDQNDIDHPEMPPLT
jgi:hypothetical protein